MARKAKAMAQGGYPLPAVFAYIREAQALCPSLAELATLPGTLQANADYAEALRREGRAYPESSTPLELEALRIAIRDSVNSVLKNLR
jgi:hypothetical protein